MPTTKVYRSGVVCAPGERGVESASYLAADAVKPEGRQGRTDGIFASPTLPGVTRWARANSYTCNPDWAVRELAVDATQVYVYSVQAWERVDRLGYDSYWATGMTLAEWLKTDLDPTEWELLLGQDDLIAVKPVSSARVLAAAADEYKRNDLARSYKAEARAKRRR